MGCCEGHHFPFAPYLTKEPYPFAAFFPPVKENAVGRQEQMPPAIAPFGPARLGPCTHR